MVEIVTASVNSEIMQIFRDWDWDDWDDKIIIQVHGTLMVIAWIFAASMGTIVARYFKQTWVKHTICGSEIWFFLHRAFMLLTWCLTIIGFIIIYIDMDDIEYFAAHDIVGFITVALCFIQPILAALNQYYPNRPRIRWAHMICGTTTYTAAMICLFLAIPLKEIELPMWLNWILTGFVIFHVGVHVALTILGYMAEERTSPEGLPAGYDAPLSSVRKIILGIYTILVIAFTVIIIVVISFTPMAVFKARLDDEVEDIGADISAIVK